MDKVRSDTNLYTVIIHWFSQMHLYLTIFYWLKQPKILLFQPFFVVLTKYENASETTNLKLVILTKIFSVYKVSNDLRLSPLLTELIRSKRNITGHDVSGSFSYMQVTQHTSKNS